MTTQRSAVKFISPSPASEDKQQHHCLSRKTSPEVSKGKTASVHRPQWLWSISGDVQIETQKSIARACKARPATRPGVVKKILTLRTGDVAQLVACWPSMHKASHKTRHGDMLL